LLQLFSQQPIKYNSPLAGIPYFSRLAKKRKDLKWQNPIQTADVDPNEE
jgi:hypothetical protein